MKWRKRNKNVKVGLKILRANALLIPIMLIVCILVAVIPSPAQACGGSIRKQIKNSPPMPLNVEIVVEFDKSEYEYHENSNMDGVLYCSGTVMADATGLTNAQSIVISLLATCSWPTGVSPSSMTFTKSELGTKKPFDVSVMMAPPKSNEESKQKLELGGEYRVTPGTTGGEITPGGCWITYYPYNETGIEGSNEGNESSERNEEDKGFIPGLDWLGLFIATTTAVIITFWHWRRVT